MNLKPDPFNLSITLSEAVILKSEPVKFTKLIADISFDHLFCKPNLFFQQLRAHPEAFVGEIGIDKVSKTSYGVNEFNLQVKIRNT